MALFTEMVYFLYANKLLKTFYNTFIMFVSLTIKPISNYSKLNFHINDYVFNLHEAFYPWYSVVWGLKY